jgi:hypothetical protein
VRSHGGRLRAPRRGEGAVGQRGDPAAPVEATERTGQINALYVNGIALRTDLLARRDGGFFPRLPEFDQALEAATREPAIRAGRAMRREHMRDILFTYATR